MAYKIVQSADGTIAMIDGCVVQSNEDRTSPYSGFIPGQFTDCCCKKYILTPCFAGDVIHTHTDLSAYFPYLGVPDIVKLDNQNCYRITVNYTNLPGTVEVVVINSFYDWYGTGCEDCCSEDGICSDCDRTQYSPALWTMLFSGITVPTSVNCPTGGQVKSYCWITPPTVSPNGGFSVPQIGGGCGWGLVTPCGGMVKAYSDFNCTGDVEYIFQITGYEINVSMPLWGTLFKLVGAYRYRHVEGGVPVGGEYWIRTFHHSKGQPFNCREDSFSNGYVDTGCDYHLVLGYGGVGSYASATGCG